MIDKDIAVGVRVVTVDMNEGVAAHIGHSSTAEHLTQRVLQRTLCACLGNSTDIARFHRHLRTSLHFTLVSTTIHITSNTDLSLNGEGTGQRNDK